MTNSRLPERLHWLCGSVQSDRDEALLRLTSGLITPQRLPEWVALVPTRRRKRFLRDAFMKTEEGRVWTPRIELIPESVRKFREQAPEGDFKLAGEVEQLVCVEEALRRCRTELEYFKLRSGDLSKRSGIIYQLGRFISFIKQNGLDTEFVNRLILDDAGNSGPKDHDLTKILNAYHAVMSEQGFIDAEDLLMQVTDAWLKMPVDQMHGQLLIIDSFTFLTRLEESYLRALMPRFEEVAITLDWPDGGIEEILSDLELGKERMSHQGYRSYLSMRDFLKDLRAGVKNQNIPEAKPAKKFPLADVLFSRHAKWSENAAQEPVDILPAQNRVEEIRIICREIKRLALSGEDLERIHVVFPRIEEYVSIIYELFPRYGIPFSITRGLPLISSPLAIVMGALLRIPQRFDREDLFRFFSSNLVTYFLPNDAPAFEAFIRKYGIGEQSSLMTADEILQRYRDFQKENADRGVHYSAFDMQTLDRYARSANIRGGEDIFYDWFVPLDRIYFVGRYLGERAAQESEGERPDRIKQLYFRILRQLYFLDNIQELFRPFQKATSPSEVLSLLRDRVRHFKIQSNLVKRLQELPSLNSKDRVLLLKRDLSALAKVFEILDELDEGLTLKEKLRDPADKTDSPLEITSSWLQQRFRESFILDPLDSQVVQITETLELRGINFNYCFFGGLTHDAYPRVADDDFILPETPNARLRILDPQDESKYLFSYVLKNTAKHLYLLYPRLDRDKLMKPSYFLEDLIVVCQHLKTPPEKRLKSYYCEEDLEVAIGERLISEKPHSFDEGVTLLEESANADQLRRALNCELSRMNNVVFGSFDGIVEGFETAYPDIRNKVFSVSQLDQYAICPQEYFYGRILGLEPLDEINDEIEESEFGSYVHEILEKFFSGWVKDPQNQSGIRAANFPTAVAQMQQAAQDVLGTREKNIEYVLWDRRKEKIISGLDADFDSEKTPKGILRALLEKELEYSDKSLIPKRFEWRFGYDAPFEVAGVKLRGKIDRLDELGGDKRGYWIYDYKTGRIPDRKNLKKGLNLQLPVYLMALRSEFSSEHFGGGYYALKDPLKVDVKARLVSQSLSEEKNFFGSKKSKDIFSKDLSGLFSGWIEQLSKNIRAGVFHTAFEDFRCGYCDFKTICRRDAARQEAIEQFSVTSAYYVPSRNLEQFKKVVK